MELVRALTVAGLLLAGCRGAPSAEAERASLRLRFSEDPVELGALAKDQLATRELILENPTRVPLSVERIEASRFCRLQLASLSLEPAASAKVKLECRSDLPGPLSEKLRVFFRGRREPLVLSVRGRIEPRLGFSPDYLEATLPFGESRRLTAKLTGTELGRAKPVLVPVTEPEVEVRWLGQESLLEVVCRATSVGSHTGSVKLETGLTEPSSLTLSYGCRVVGTLRIEPSNPLINLKGRGKKQVRVSVDSSAPDFEVSSVTITDGPFRAELLPRGPGTRREILVELLPKRVILGTRGVKGTLELWSNDPGEPRREIPLVGLGQFTDSTEPSASSFGVHPSHP